MDDHIAPKRSRAYKDGVREGTNFAQEKRNAGRSLFTLSPEVVIQLCPFAQGTARAEAGGMGFLEGLGSLQLEELDDQWNELRLGIESGR